MATRVEELCSFGASILVLLLCVDSINARIRVHHKKPKPEVQPANIVSGIPNQSVFDFFDDPEPEIEFSYNYVTCGSSLKLYNPKHGVRLHSHDVKYGSGSGQQSVTAVESSDDNNSYWTIKPRMGEECVRGEAVKCKQVIRLMHVTTGKNLHSHHFTSPLSHNLEVSAFGDDGTGDEGDHWSVMCSGQYWERDQKVHLKHVVTDSYLHISGDTYGRPIYGQREVSAYSSKNAMNEWKAAEGIFIKPAEASTGLGHDEL